MLGRFVDTCKRMVNESIGNRTRCPVRPECRFNLGGFAVRVGGAREGANSPAGARHRPEIATGTTRFHRALASRSAPVCDVILICDRAALRRLLVTCANENGLEVRGRTASGDIERRPQSAAPPGRDRCNGMVHLRWTRCRCRRSMRVEWPSGIPGRSPPGAFRSRSRGEPVHSSRT